VIDTSTNTVTATISFGAGKSNLMAASPVSERVYVTDILCGCECSTRPRIRR
jgi:DNA-binding beta-propeller fold protein YncE